jgi:Peptidase family M23
MMGRMNRLRRGLGLVVLFLAPAGCGSSADETGSAGAGGASAGGTSSGGASFGGGSGTWPGTGGAAGSSASAGSGGTAGAGGGATGGTGGSATNPICLGPQAGAYCGNDAMQDADADTLYECPGANKAPSSSTPCANGCMVEVQGKSDHCKLSPPTGSYRLPWQPGVSMQLTQDCNDSCCNDHVNDDGYAWDFANATSFTVVAAHTGTVTHLKINSTTGCGASSCADDANLIVIDHGDGTQATYLHLEGMSLASGVSCGASVQRGQALATAGTTGWSTGVHLHFQVGQVHSGAATCECGSDGTGCSAGSVPWSSFWSTVAYPTVPISFDEWPEASSCADRRISMPASQNQ